MPMAIKISLFIMCIVGAMAVINSMGIMEQHEPPAQATMDTTGASTIMQVNSSSSEQLSNQFFGWGSISAIWSGFSSLLYMLFLPGIWLSAHGCNAVLAGLIQVACNASFVLLVLQLAMKFGLRGTI